MKDADSRVVAEYLARPDVHRQWESAYRTEENERFYELVFDALAKEIGAPPDATVLDVGCGICAHSVRLARRGFKVSAVDFAETILSEGRARVREAGLESSIEIRQADILSLPFENGSMPYMLCWGVLMHIPEVERAIEELSRVLADDGILVVSEGNVRSMQAFAIRTLKRLLRRDMSTLKRTPAGLEDWTVSPAGTLLTREADIPWIVDRFRRHGVHLVRRRAGQFTELYTKFPPGFVRKAIHGFNRVWFERVQYAPWAFGNVLILRKRG